MQGQEDRVIAEAEVLEVLVRESGLSPEQIGQGASFTELGFDSFGLMKLSEAIEARFGTDVPFRRLMEDLSTLPRLTRYLAEVATGPLKAAPKAAPIAEVEAAPVVAAPGFAFAPSRPAHAVPQPNVAEALEGARLSGQCEGCRVHDVEGRELVDLSMGGGVALFGHSPAFIAEALRRQLADGIHLGPDTEVALAVARQLCALTGAERAAFCNTGTEAVMSALRIARTVTRRTGVVVLAGADHGHFDGTAAVPSPSSMRPVPRSPGVPEGMIADVMVLDYGAPAALATIERHAHELAAVLVEPIPSRRPEAAAGAWLRELRAITARHGIALVFDELVSGFRCHPAGAQARLEVRADLVLYGMILGGGLPLAAVTGTARFLDAIDGGPWAFGDESTPGAEQTFFGGTFCKHPLAMAAAAAVLTRLAHEGPALQRELDARTAQLVARLRARLAPVGADVRIHHASSWFVLTTAAGAPLPARFRRELVAHGVYAPAEGPCFLSTAHGDDALARIEDAVEAAARGLVDGGSSPAHADRRSFPVGTRQRQLWTLAQLGPEACAAFNECATLRLRGALDVDALHRVASALVTRHDALRTTFSRDGERRIVHRTLDVRLDVVDLAGEPTALAEVVRRQVGLPFDLEAGPLFRIELLRVGADDHVLLVVIHHLVTDGTSMGVLLAELTAGYVAAREGAPLPVPMGAPETTDATEASDDLEEHDPRAEQYWLAELRDPPPPLALPTDAPRPSRKTFGGVHARLGLHGSTPAELRSFAAAHEVSTFVALLGAYTVLLHHLCRQPDLVVGVLAAGPSHDRAPRVGYFVHLLPLRSRVTPGLRFVDHLHATRRRVLDAYEHQRVSLTALTTKLGIRPEPTRPPLIATSFNVDRPAPALSIPGLEVEADTPQTGLAKYDVGVNIDDTSLTFDWILDRDLFVPATAERWMAQLGALLTAVRSRPELDLAALEVVLEGAAAAWRERVAEDLARGARHGLRELRRR